MSINMRPPLLICFILITVASAHFSLYIPQTFQADLYMLISGGGQQIQYKGTIRYDSTRLHRRITVADDWSNQLDTIYRFDLVRSSLPPPQPSLLISRF